EVAPDGRGLGKVAGGDVVADMVPFGQRQYPPQGLVRPDEAVEICGPIIRPRRNPMSKRPSACEKLSSRRRVNYSRAPPPIKSPEGEPLRRFSSQHIKIVAQRHNLRRERIA